MNHKSVRVLLVVAALSSAALLVRAAPPKDAPGYVMPPPPASVLPAPRDPKPAVAAEGWKAETIMLAPGIHTPSVVCAIPDGRVLVAEHPLSNFGGKVPIDRILCIHPDGKITVFADGLYAVFGLAYLDGKVFVHHYPILSVFTDDNGVGKNKTDIINQTGKATIGGLNDHIAAQIRLAMDGYFYLDTGDRGVWGATSNVDGRQAELAGGGLLRIRPDGTGLEVYCTGTRNHLDVSINNEDEMFTYDNTDDGHGWWTRFTHMVDGGFYGYPWDYKPEENKNDPASRKTPTRADPNVPYQPYTLWRAAEYGGGSPTGAIGYNEDGLPAEYRGNLFHCEWGKGKIQRFVVERDGGTYKVVKQEDMLKAEKGSDLRPTGICVTTEGDGFWVTDWGYGGWMQKKEAGRLIKLTYTGKSVAAAKPAWFVPAATAEPFTASTAELIEGLKHPAESVRQVAQRRIAERGQEAVAGLIALLNDTKAPADGRMFAIWTLDRIDAGKPGRAAITAVAADAKADPAVRRQAIRELGERRVTEATDAIVAALNDADASIRFRAATALGRIGNPAAVPGIIAKLDEKDLFTRFALFTALNRIGKADPKAWPAIVKGLENQSDSVRANITYALRNTFDPQLVSALTTEAFDKTKPAAARASALLSAAELHRQPKPWGGNWWGTQPVGSPRPAKVVDWEGTTTVLSAIRDLVKDTDPQVRQAAIKSMSIAPDPTAADVLVDLYEKHNDVEVRKSVLKALAGAKSPKAGQLAAGVLKDPKANAALVPDAIAVVEASGSKDAIPSLIALVDSSTTPEILEPAFNALGVLKAGQAAAPIAMHLRSNDPVVTGAAINALTQINNQAAVDALVILLSDQRADVAKASAGALGTMKAKSAIPALIAAAGPKSPIKTEAVQSLVKMPTVEAIDPFLATLAGNNVGLKKQVLAAMVQIAAEAKPVLEAKAEAGQIPPEALSAVQTLYDAPTALTTWQVLGPFDITKPDPFPGDKPDQYPGKDAVLKGANGKDVKWKTVTTKEERGMVDLPKFTDPSDHVNTFLLAEFNSPADREIEIILGSDDFHLVWLNGKVISDDTKNNSGWNYDEKRVKAQVKAGKNILLARVGNDSGPYQFSAAVTGERKGKLFDPIAAKRPDRAAFEKFALANKGDAANGKKIFNNVQTVGCVKCHQTAANDNGGIVGPSLQGVGAKYDRAKLCESVLYPSKQIFDGYEQWIVKTKDGEVYNGVVRSEDEKTVTMYDTAAQKIVIKKADVVSRKKSELSAMPEGLEQALTPQEFADLLSYLESLKETPPAAKQ